MLRSVYFILLEVIIHGKGPSSLDTIIVSNNNIPNSIRKSDIRKNEKNIPTPSTMQPIPTSPKECSTACDGITGFRVFYLSSNRTMHPEC